MVIDIPPSRLVTCVYCADRLDSNAIGTFQRASGWVPNVQSHGKRKGNNRIAMIEYRHVFACDVCISKLRAGIPVGQLSLLEQWTDTDGT